MANPSNAFGTNASFSGRTTVNAFNDDLAIYQGRGIVSGFQLSAGTGMEVLLGGAEGIRDVAIAEDNNGNKTTINNRTGVPISIAIAAAPTTGTRIDALVAYVKNPPVSTGSVSDGYDAVGYLGVQSANTTEPTQPTDEDIRAAITADGAGGTIAYYVVFGYVQVATGTTDITPELITQGEGAMLKSDILPVSDDAVTSVLVNGQEVVEDGVATIPSASTTSHGVVMLSDATNSSSQTNAATANAVNKVNSVATTAQQTATEANQAAATAQQTANSKATITVTDVDPGEGSPLEAGHFIAVYDSAAAATLEMKEGIQIPIPQLAPKSEEVDTMMPEEPTEIAPVEEPSEDESEAEEVGSEEGEEE